MAKENSLGDIFKIHLNCSKFHSLFFPHYPFVNSVAALLAAPNGKLDLSAIGWANR